MSDPEATRAALRAGLRIFRSLEKRAVLDTKVHLAHALEAGLPFQDAMEALGVKSRGTIYEWKKEGELERDRRRGPDPERPGD